MLIEVEQYTLLYNETRGDLWLYNQKRCVEERHDVWKDQQRRRRGQTKANGAG